ncbi:erythromycin biosynthesis sensory transduction protein eryC1 [Lysinibacillus contaminans]|uniref:Erythromycin biosynthesis sensory transduction protein eryC1 n=1 Tax=Lysinibacillus contaminans TaxID=1293441 RepID=A0ABR5JXK4_9BACI|nr:DegT/DnrJ/EryC1/StrS family aminotransferase [Lysinibacillus contaminans]KOS66682.1 erythromycin biosynthesis sensory transduction protein eryC1 [Lysinibacillus contaminans]
MSNIPIFDLKGEIELLKSDFLTSISNVLDSGKFILGDEVQRFEQQVAEYLGVKYAVGVNSGTDALIIALRAIGVKKGDEVITTPFTFFATVEAIELIGATPILVDIDINDFNIDVVEIEKSITAKTTAILPVHIFGHPANMDEIIAIANKYNLKIVEDVAQAFGAKIAERKVGTFGNVGCFSFFPTKNLGAYGDGGLIVTNEFEVAEVAKKLRVHGGKDKYSNELFGYNSRLDEIQAAILNIKLKYLDEWNSKRKNVADLYCKKLKDISSIKLPIEKANCNHVYHQFTIRVLEENRDDLYQYLLDNGVQSMIYYSKPIHKLPVYNELYSNLSFPVSELASKQVLSLPIWPHITESQIEIVCGLIKKYFS